MKVKKIKTSILLVVVSILMFAILILSNTSNQSLSAGAADLEVSSESVVAASAAAAPVPYLSLQLIEKSSWNKWKIKVSNTHSEKITFEYNTLMCFRGDAETWTKLNHPGTGALGIEAYNNYAVVTIQENWAADSFAFCWLYNGKRLITYGYKPGNTMTALSLTI